MGDEQPIVRNLRSSSTSKMSDAVPASQRGPTVSQTNNLVVDLIAALQSEAVTEAIANALSPRITAAVEETVTKSLLEINSQLQKLTDENKQLKQKTDELSTENKSLKLRLTTVEETIDTMDRNERNYSVIIAGLPEETYAERATESAKPDGASADSQKSVENTILAFINSKLHINAESDQISISYRLKKGKNDKYRPVYVKFVSRKLRNSVLAAKKSLKGERIYISEHLTRANLDIFHKVRILKKRERIHSFWTWNGQVYVKTSADQSCKPVLVKSPADLPALADV